MEKWILAADLLERGKPSAVNLTSAVKCGELKAYDTNSDNPIDWKEIEEQFEEIKNICEEKYFEEGRLRKVSSVDRERKLVLLKARVSVFNDYYPMPWNVLYNHLKSGRPTEIPETQYFEILEGWGDNQITYFVKTAKFKEEDVERVFPEKEDDIGLPQEKTLLKFIGALIEIHYLQKKPDTYKKTSGKPNISAIADTFYKQLPNANLDDDGIKQDNIRKKIIPSALEQIQMNKTPQE